MGFQETYREEVIASRRSRGRTAVFLGRLIGVGLMLATVAVMQREPGLRLALIDAGAQAVARVIGMETVSAEVTPEAVGALPASRVPVSRGGVRVTN